MVTWRDFAAAEPELAAVGRSLLHQFGVGLAFLATVRKDGAPRLHPVCPVLSDDRLFVLVTPASPKWHDLMRDGRYALQTFPQPKPGSDEFCVAGRAVLVEHPATRARTAKLVPRAFRAVSAFSAAPPPSPPAPRPVSSRRRSTCTARAARGCPRRARRRRRGRTCAGCTRRRARTSC